MTTERQPHLRHLALLALGLLIVPLAAVADTTVDGQTPGGAFYQIVVPDNWSGDLLLWNNGFSLGQPGPVDGLEDQFFLQLLEGWAVASSSYRMKGWAVFRSNEDLEELVAAFEGHFRPPDRIVVAGGSLGGLATAAAIEKARLGNVVGGLTYCGVLGGSRNWEASLDLRLVYDAVCGGVAGAAIPGGAEGVPAGSSLTGDDVARAVNVCTGVDLPKILRTRKQKRRLKRLVKTTKIPESFIQTTMSYATFGMADLVHDRRKLKGKVGVGNRDVDYGKKKINRKIERVEPKKRAARRLRRSFTPTGNVGSVKILSLHTSGDGLVFVENLSAYASVVPPTNLTTAVAVEKFPSHCLFTPAEIFAGWSTLRAWIDGGPQPTAADVQDKCDEWASILGGPCRFDPDFRVPAFDTRVRPR
jgi:pimeloyl-ACP methyl ester carboxylesterase